MDFKGPLTGMLFGGYIPQLDYGIPQNFYSVDLWV